MTGFPSLRAYGYSGLTLLIVLTAHAAVKAPRHPTESSVPFPDGYREWAHIKSALVSSRHPNFQQSGGFRHIYANREAVIGYRTGTFPQGSIIVVDWIEGVDTDGAFAEGSRRRLDVMQKQTAQFAASGGWGFERFNGDTRERTVTNVATQCSNCHGGPDARGMVFSKWRP